MRAAWIFLGILALSAARTLKKRDDDGDDSNHWESVFLAGAKNDYTDVEKENMLDNIVGDMGHFLSVVEKAINGENVEQNKYDIVNMLSGALLLVKMHEEKAENGHVMIAPKPVTIPARCTRADVEALGECDAMVKRVLECIQGGGKAMVATLSDKAISFEDRVGEMKSFINKIVAELEGIKMLFRHCSKPLTPEHWKEAWKLTEADLSNSDEAETKLKDLGMKIYNDVKDIRDNLDILLSGKGTEHEFKKAEQHLAAAVALAEFHERQGADTIQPDKVPIDADCTNDEINSLDNCGEKYFRVGTCMRRAVDRLINRMENNNRDYVALAKYMKGVVMNVAKVPKLLQEIASSCSQLDIQHWERAWMITEEELKDPANMEKFKQLGMRIHDDMVKIRDNLAALLGGKGGDFELALKHLDAAVKLAELHEEKGGQSITPSVLPIASGCTKDEVLALVGCEKRAIRIGTCIKETVDSVIKEMRSNADIVEIAMFTKGSVLNIAKADAIVKDVIAGCESEHKEADDKKRELVDLLRRILQK
ncbi:uncharacterized protein LOC133192765 [Saccostrea echinata]|uniref:uncharacterized protein LOC133192765 n=1 Tax=Saccostrea echinata TaxID=191078 RepID=UPI002A813C87|nr:uncharacterized protein LOC133192765 [Saccostrea echinata]